MKNVIVAYFQGPEVITTTVPQDELAYLAGSTTFWQPEALADDEMERKGKVLKETCRKRLFTNTVLTPTK